MKDKTWLQKNVFLIHKIIILVELVFLAIIANHYQIVLYLIFFLLPVYLAKNFNLDSIFKIFISIGTWIIFNYFLLSRGYNNPVQTTTPNAAVNSLNILLIAWGNFILYFSCFYKLVSKNVFNKISYKKALVFMLILSSIETIGCWDRKFIAPYLGEFFLAGIVFSIFYIVFLSQCFSKKTCFCINFLFSIAPIITFFFTFFTVLAVLMTFGSSNDRRPCFMWGYYFLNLSQVISLSSITFYFMKDKHFINKSIIVKVFSMALLLLLLSICVVMQTKYEYFFKF